MSKLLPEDFSTLGPEGLRELSSSLREQGSALNVDDPEISQEDSDKVADQVIAIGEALGEVQARLDALAAERAATLDRADKLDKALDAITAPEAVEPEAETLEVEAEVAEAATETEVAIEVVTETLEAETPEAETFEVIEGETEVDPIAEKMSAIEATLANLTEALATKIAEETATIEVLEVEPTTEVVTTEEVVEEVVSEVEELSTEEVAVEETTTEEITDEVEEMSTEDTSETVEETEVVAEVEAEELSTEEVTEEVVAEVEELSTEEITEEVVTEEVVAEDSTEEVLDTEVSEEIASSEAETTETIESPEELSTDQEIAMEKTEGAVEVPEIHVGSGVATPQATMQAAENAVTKNTGDTFANAEELGLELLSNLDKRGMRNSWANAKSEDTFYFASLQDDAVTGGSLVSQGSEEANYSTLAEASANFSADTEAGLVASGGICAPFPIDYSFFRLATPQASVENAFPVVSAPRGGIRFIVPPDHRQARGAITTVTCNEDMLGYESTPGECLPVDENGDPIAGAGTTPDKPCACVPCATTGECCLTAIPWCVRFGNFNYRSFPELISNYMKDLMVEIAMVKNAYYLDAMAASSTFINGVANVSAVRNVIWDIRAAATNYRARHSMNPDAVLQLFAPDWVREVMKQDIANSQWGSNPLQDYLWVSDDQLDGVLRGLGVRVNFYHGTPTVLPPGVPPQAFDEAIVAGGDIPQFPTTALFFMFAPGTFVKLDGGAIDFGIVRDSSLIATNDFIIAAETFEGLCQVGGESIMFTSNVCPTGAFGTGIEIACA